MKYLRNAGVFAVVGLLSASLAAGQSGSLSSGRRLFNIVDYGAKKDASMPATEAFRGAIAAAKAAGGGTIYVPPGRYSTGPIELFSNMTLDVDAGATIDFPVAPIPFEKTRYLGVEALAPMALIGARNAENVTVTGRGTLTTAYYDDWGKAYGPAPVISDKSENSNGPHWEHLLKSLQSGTPISDAEARAAAVLDRNWSTVEETAAALLEHETLSGVALDAVLSTVQEVSLEELAQVRRAAPPRFTSRDPKQAQ